MLADALLVVHFFIAGFIVGGLILVWIGASAGWAWVRNPGFRCWVFTSAYVAWTAATVLTLRFVPPRRTAG